MSYFRWPIQSDITLFLEIVKSDGNPLTGSDPQVMIRRYREVNGGLLDNYYFSGSTFTSTPFSRSMSQIDATNQPGVYNYIFSQSLIQSGTVYAVYYKHNSIPVGFTSEYHLFESTGSSGAVNVYESEIN